MSKAARLEAMAQRAEKHFFNGSFRLHIVPSASRGKVFGVGLMEELQRHGYRTSPGTLYPIRHALERSAYLTPRSAVGGKRDPEAVEYKPRRSTSFPSRP